MSEFKPELVNRDIRSHDDSVAVLASTLEEIREDDDVVGIEIVIQRSSGACTFRGSYCRDFYERIGMLEFAKQTIIRSMILDETTSQ